MLPRGASRCFVAEAARGQPSSSLVLWPYMHCPRTCETNPLHLCHKPWLREVMASWSSDQEARWAGQRRLSPAQAPCTEWTRACRTGRVQVTLVTRLADVAMLLAMAALPPQGSMIGFLIALHLTRMATANCTRCVCMLTLK